MELLTFLRAWRAMIALNIANLEAIQEYKIPHAK